MPLPEHLQDALSKELEQVPKKNLSLAANELSERYRHPSREASSQLMSTFAHRLAYLAVRLPATYAAVCRVLEEIKHRIPGAHFKSVLDMGAGPGTATWAVSEVFADVDSATLLEQDDQLLQIGQRMMTQGATAVLKNAKWQKHNLNEALPLMTHDLIVLSYVVGELTEEVRKAVVDQAWAATGKLIVIIEPGTPHGFERIRKSRDQLIAKGAHLVAPCPHAKKCPMEGDNWCHFSERLERSSWHMETKDVSLGYEDEKFSYLVASKFPVALPEARILRHPQKHSGHLTLTLCSQEGEEERTVSRRQKDLYKKSRKLKWGDAFPPNTGSDEREGDSE